MSTGSVLQPPKILCVDGDPTALLLYREILAEQDFAIETATTAEQGLALARRFLPDLIVSDVRLSGASGHEFCREVRRDAYLGTAMFILASGPKADPGGAVADLAGGADDYILKPIRKSELVAKLQALLRIKRLQDDLLVSNQKLTKALNHLKRYKGELEKKHLALQKEKAILQNSLQQISLMAHEREETHSRLEQLFEVQEGNFTHLTTLLAGIIESKRQYHRGHSKQVAEIAAFIAQQLGLPREEIRSIRIAALLHELGKLSVPDDLALKNPATYSQQEKELLMQHPLKGAAMLQKFSGFEKIARIIRHTHEHVDGSGVPDGLQGDQIPIGSRIIEAAGLYDNLVYRTRDGGAADAMARIEEQIGTRLDPAVVRHLAQYAARHPRDESERIREVSLYELQPGMILACGICTTRGMKLLPANTAITTESISQITHYHQIDPIEEIVFIRE
jgi:putative nucleotidyltransferase with HDIG domain